MAFSFSVMFQFNTSFGTAYLLLCRIRWHFLLLCRKFHCQIPKGIKSRNKEIFKWIWLEQILHRSSTAFFIGYYRIPVLTHTFSSFDHVQIKIMKNKPNAHALLTAVNSSLSSPISSRIVLHSAPRKLRRLTA